MTLHVRVEPGTPTFVTAVEATPWAGGSRRIIIPSDVRDGDIGFVITGQDAGTASSSTDPSGWTRIVPDTAATNSNWRVITRVRQPGDPGDILFGGTLNGTVVAFWYRNARLGAVGTRWIRGASSNTVTCPLLERTATGSVLLAIAGDRSIAATAGEQGYTSVTGATYARRYEGDPTLSSGTNICATFYAEIAPAGAPSDVVWTLNDASTNAIGFQIELIPSSDWRKVTQPRLKLTNAWRNATAVFTKVDGTWREVWPGTGNAPKIGVPSTSRKNLIPPPEGSGIYSWNMPYYGNVPTWFVTGDKARIASCYVSIRWTPNAPKSPVEHTVEWTAPVGWGIYCVLWNDGAGGCKYYYAAMTDAEVAAITAPKYAIEMWTPKNGGYFMYMPACWDVSGVTVPMRDDAAGGLDEHSGYAPFPPNRSATSALADYTVANGYTDMLGSNSYTMVGITLRDVTGSTLDSWTGALPNGTVTHVPGLGVGPASLEELAEATKIVTPEKELYWPEEWQGLFNHVEPLPQRVTVQYGRETFHGIAEWDVFADVDQDPYRTEPTNEKIGDFRLAMRRGYPNIIEIHGVNLKPDLIGMNLMRTIVEHGVLYCPTPYVIVKPPDRITFDVMRSWGWRTFEDGSEALDAATWILDNDRADMDKYLGMVSNPVLNRFFMLGMPDASEVAR